MVKNVDLEDQKEVQIRERNRSSCLHNSQMISSKVCHLFSTITSKFRIVNFPNKMTLTCFIISGKISNDPPPLKKAKLDAGDNDSTPSTDSGNQLTVDVVKNNPLKWNVEQVCDFVKNLAGCSDYVEDFQLQEIDGQALMLLKADHLMSAMSIKLGPALKICSAIEGMRDELSKN